MYFSLRQITVLLLACGTGTTAFVANRPAFAQQRTSTMILKDIVSPFDDTNSNDANVATTSAPPPSDDGPYELTWENVEMVLDEMRPYLIQDGGNVAITEIDGPVVRLELQVCVTRTVEMRVCCRVSETPLSHHSYVASHTGRISFCFSRERAGHALLLHKP